jgi:uncharacterized protein
VVEEAESSALLAAFDRADPYVTSVVGDIETARACHHASVPSAQLEELRNGLVLVALDEDVRTLATTAGSPTLRTLDAIHLATALMLREDLDAMITYDVRLARAVEAAGLPLLSPA